MERPEQDAGPSTRAAIAAGSAVPGRRAGSLPGPASSLTASLPLDSGSKATAPAPARAPSFQPNLEPLRSTLTLEFSCFFATAKQQLRRRLGRAHLGRDMEDQPAQAALAANLLCPHYVRIVCGTLDRLPQALAALDRQAIKASTPLQRNNKDAPLRKRIRAWAATDE